MKNCVCLAFVYVNYNVCAVWLVSADTHREKSMHIVLSIFPKVRHWITIKYKQGVRFTWGLLKSCMMPKHICGFCPEHRCVFATKATGLGSYGFCLIEKKHTSRLVSSFSEKSYVGGESRSRWSSIRWTRSGWLTCYIDWRTLFFFRGTWENNSKASWLCKCAMCVIANIDFYMLAYVTDLQRRQI